MAGLGRGSGRDETRDVTSFDNREVTAPGAAYTDTLLILASIISDDLVRLPPAARQNLRCPFRSSHQPISPCNPIFPLPLILTLFTCRQIFTKPISSTITMPYIDTPACDFENVHIVAEATGAHPRPSSCLAHLPADILLEIAQFLNTFSDRLHFGVTVSTLHKPIQML